MDASDNPHRDVQHALQGLVNEGDLIVGWFAVVEVATPEGTQYLAHRTGGGLDGSSPPTLWTELGMAQATVEDIKRALAACVVQATADDDD